MKTFQQKSAVRSNSRAALCAALVLSIIMSMFALGGVSASADTSTEKVTKQYAQSTIQGSAVLHCFDWSYNEIKANMADIAEAGYTAVQTSPVQPPKDYNSAWTNGSGQWWKLYQPLGISIADGTSWLGKKAELKAMCDEAENYGIKVIVDVVANHLANNGTDGGTYALINASIEDDLKNSDYFHSDSNYINDDSRYNITQRHMNMPDLNTGNSYIQQRFVTFLKDCVDQGVDGFRFDAAKHIELPTDSGCASNFWPTVINGIKDYKSDVFCYGEILGSAGTDISNYTTYMAVTDNYTGDKMLNYTYNNNCSGLRDSTYYKGALPKNSVLWAESHDTYMGDSGSGGISNTAGVSDDVIVKTWAIVGSRADSTALYFARPNALMGKASSDTTWKSAAVAEINKFKNYFDGTTEYLSSNSDYNAAYNERGTSGVVISKLGGGGNVSLEAHKMAAGTYKDQISGNTFTVSNGIITGTVGDTGVAVVYNTNETPVIVDNSSKIGYYLCGYINGANYACDEDYTNLGDYHFVNGKVTATFEQDSYVFVKYVSNPDAPNTQQWYMTNGYPGDNATSATLYDTNTAGIKVDKLRVPANTPVRFTLTDNGDNTFTLSYKNDEVEFEGGSMVLDSQLGLIFAMHVPDKYAGSSTCKMVFNYVDTITGDLGDEISTVNLSDAEIKDVKGQQLYMFTCYLPMTAMGQMIQGTFMNGSDKLTTCRYSTDDYFSDFKVNQGDYTEAEKTLVNNTMNYCHYVQEYLNSFHSTQNDAVYNYTELSDAEVTSALTDLGNYNMTKSIENTQIADVKVSLKFDTETSIYLYIIPEDGYTGSVSIDNRVLGESDKTSLTLNDSSTVTAYKVKAADVPAHLLSQDYTVTLNANGEGSVKVSAFAYANQLANSDNAALATDSAKNAMAALYYYGKAAAAYKGTN